MSSPSSNEERDFWNKYRRLKYKEDDAFREKVREKARQYYQSHKEQKREAMRRYNRNYRYCERHGIPFDRKRKGYKDLTDEELAARAREKRAEYNAYRRRRYKEDEEYRNRVISDTRKWKKHVNEDPEKLIAYKARRKKKYLANKGIEVELEVLINNLRIKLNNDQGKKTE